MEDLVEVVKRLCMDKYFGIYTRNYVEYIVEKNFDKPYTTIIIDFNSVKTMNTLYGYEYVNNLFKAMFTTFKPPGEVVIGRWFSGDEIVIVTTNDAFSIIEMIKRHCMEYGLSFKTVLITTKEISKIGVY